MDGIVIQFIAETKAARGKLRSSTSLPTGVIIAPPNPCTTRVAISIGRLSAMPQSAEPSYKNHLGNLTMLPPGVNSSLKDKPPKKKAGRYMECGLKETVAVGRHISEHRTWTKSDVKDRAARIEAFVRREWAD